MRITVKLFATFRDGLFKEAQRDVPEGGTLGQVIAELGIAEKDVGMVLVNGRHAPMGLVLSDGLVLDIFPLLAGG
ncbi:MAG: MoaD/ThiS family protein [Desulfuromonadaceae bacterium]|nr:MoaD/ThiS family protein [Desulfuromonadaceae bacterium]